MALEQIVNRRFGAGERVELDGKSFIHCEFNGCLVVYGGGEVFWQDVTWKDCEFSFVGAANHTIQVLQAVGCVITPPIGQTIY